MAMSNDLLLLRLQGRDKDLFTAIGRLEAGQESLSKQVHSHTKSINGINTKLENGLTSAIEQLAADMGALKERLQKRTNGVRIPRYIEVAFLVVLISVGIKFALPMELFAQYFGEATDTVLAFWNGMGGVATLATIVALYQRYKRGKPIKTKEVL